ncbi:MAG: prephenate dehydratase [Bacteroidales bacterium]|uniref:prephenate dehydratase n=1 Tax=Candidatus Cryptobacteroides sp. TaxID=2952915 RepID=UPI002A75EB16|nr:prephenate dehydratase [Candidatus Cryptobacteroides sp.]MDD7234641.1 prephenate dehydratase [Bacteroidales bacterium]MDY2701461.1 prephenate dehydratase [Candidatus Cryptobacteroides sp.]
MAVRIYSDSLFLTDELDRMKKVAIQGYRGCFHEQASREFYSEMGEDIRIVECPTFESLFKAMEDGAADAAVMAIENTISGGLIPNFELLRSYPFRIKGEVYIRIEQNLMALPGQRIEDIRQVRTHYMAINQTRKFFEENCPWITVVEHEDTAKAAIEIASEGLIGVGAVASSLAAEQNGLQILAPGIETYKQNFTRFLILDDSLTVPKSRIDKATLCFTLPHKPGSLAQILTILSFYDMNLTRIQSLPIPGHEWQYFFYADIKFSTYARYRQALKAARPLMKDLNVLGEYKSAQ